LQAIVQLCDMGFPRQQVEACMRAANNDAELAANHLLSADSTFAQSQDTSVPASSAAGAASAGCIESVEQVGHPRIIHRRHQAQRVRYMTYSAGYP
jgi:hypothetical protein